MRLFPIYFLFLFSFLISLFYSVYEGWYSSTIFWIFGAGASLIFLRTKFHKDAKEVVGVFLLAYSFYSLYMFITNFIYVENPSTDFFMMVDSMKFWDNSNLISSSFSEVWENFQQMKIETARYRLFNLISIILGFLSQLVDQNNILVQKLQSVWLGAFSMPYIYLMLKKYIGVGKAYKYTNLFAVFSFVCIYSVIFNRDPHVYFLYTIGTYLLIFNEEKKFVFIKLLIILILLTGFRIEHAMFFTIFIIAFIYLRAQKNKSLILLGGILFPIFLITTFPFLLNKYEDNTEAYYGQIDRTERKEHSFGATFATFPPGLKQTAMMINSQIAPAVPFWRFWFIENVNRTILKHTQEGYYTPWRFMESIAALTWIYVWGIIIFGFYKKLYHNTPKEILVLFFIAIFLLLAASSSTNVRRIYAVYPAIFLLAAYWYNYMDKRQRRKIINRTTLFLVAIYAMYFIVK